LIFISFSLKASFSQFTCLSDVDPDKSRIAELCELSKEHGQRLQRIYEESWKVESIKDLDDDLKVIFFFLFIVLLLKKKLQRLIDIIVFARLMIILPISA
jgi:hypothetical protein